MAPAAGTLVRRSGVCSHNRGERLSCGSVSPLARAGKWSTASPNHLWALDGCGGTKGL